VQTFCQSELAFMDIYPAPPNHTFIWPEISLFIAKIAIMTILVAIDGMG
jgi:hypothetical protein